MYDWAQTPFEWHEELFMYAAEIGITIISTPFDETAVDLLESLNCPFYKVASFEFTDIPLIKYIAKTKKPIILSTGMANEDEINETLKVVKNYGCGDFILLHCVSGYPTPVSQINLKTIELMKDKFDCEVGLSDHTLGNTSAILSISFGAKLIEKHFTYRRSDGGPDAEFSMEPNELKDLSHNLSVAYQAIGEGSFKMKAAEESNIKFRRSIYAIKKINKGDIFCDSNIKRIRPGYGLEPKYFEEIIGKTATRDIEEASPIKLSDFT